MVRATVRRPSAAGSGRSGHRAFKSGDSLEHQGAILMNEHKLFLDLRSFKKWLPFRGAW